MTTTQPFRAIARRLSVRVVLAVFTALALMLIERGSGHPILHATSPTIAQENALAGSTDWDITGAGDPDIQGFATDISVNVGQTVQFKIAAPGAAAYQMNIYRLGYYGGAGARLITTVSPSATLPQAQPACLEQMATTGLVDCGNWAVSASWDVPLTAVSGIYIAKPVRADNGHNSHIVFVVRDDSRTADIVFQTSDTTWQAYNQYPGVSNNPPGASLYCGGPLSNAGSAYLRSCATRAAKVSYNRPIDTRAHDPQSFLFNAEYPMVRWLEANGFDVKYQSGVDTDRRGFDLTGANKPRAFLSVGHDEYWSGNQRKTVENARNAGVNLAFLSGNEMYWKTRYEQSIDGSGTPYRTLVSYKETIANAKIDPAVDPITGVPIWTGTWRDPRFASVSDGGQPENGLIGQIFTVNCCSDRIKIPQEMGGLRLWANTSVSAAPVNDFYRTQDEILGYEWDEDLDNGSRPQGVIHLSSTTLVEPEKLSDFGANVAQGTATHTLTLYRHNSGALVFGAGTVQWSWGLDGQHDRGNTASAHTPDQAIVQATVNLLADMDIQPTTLQASALDSLTLQQRAIVAGTKSTDINAPTSAIVFPAAGASVPSGSRLTITGTSTDPTVNGIHGIVAGVEVSVDNGATWHEAKGTSTWNYDWTPGTLGSATIKVRGIDDSGNRESAGAGVTVVVVQGDCPCTSLWKPTTVPPIPDSADGNAYELGVKFNSDTTGFITGVRYYKSVSNTGTHEGSLWSSSGTRLATATFVNETQSGWQQVLFNTPVPITAGTTYIASYHTNVGHYAATNDYFTSASVDSPPLHAPTTVAAGGNGVFVSGNSAFPTTTFRDTNYWVDVIFSATSTDTTPPTISNLRDTTIDSSKVTISWTTDEPANSKVEYSTDFTFPQAQTLSVSDAAFVTTRSLLITGLRPNTTYYYRATSIDQAGNTTTSPAPSFTVPGPTLRDTAQSDFLAGTGTGTYASATQDGELILPPTVGTEFSGTTMPPGWTEWAWSANGYSAVGGGSLIVDGARVAMCATDQSGACVPGETQSTTPSAIYSPGHTVEFVATFTGDRAQHAGFGQTLNSAFEPWAIFSTMDGGALNARSNTGAAAIETFLGSGFVGAPHLFRIEWTQNTINYYIDGNLVVSHAVAVNGPMRPIAASDFNEFGGNVTVNWMRMTPYTPLSGVFDSRIFDAEAPVDWKSIQWQTTTPAGTSVAISMRSGNTATPDATWTDWVPVASSGPLSVNSRFIQYRAALTSSNSEVTPQLEDIIISTGHAPVANPDSAIVPENGSHVFQASGPTSLTANDTDADPGDILRVTAVTQPTHGSAILNNDGSVTYTPTATYSGPDAFTYTVSDGLLTASALVSIDVRFGNIPPVANNDFYSVDEDTTLSVPAAIGVLTNDTDTENDPLTAALTVLPLHGMLTFSSNGGFTYTPNPNYAGPDSFKYRASDGADQSNEATVSIAVNQVNDPPITEADNYVAVVNQPLDVAAPGVLRNDHDVEVEDTTPLHAVLVTGPSHGQLTFNSDGSFSYVANAEYLGVDSFTYRAVDHFNAAGNVATVTLTTALKAADQTLTGAGQVSIGTGLVDASDPLSSSVTSPMAARVTIAQGVIAASQAPTGYTFVNRQINIGITDSTGTDITAATSNPIRLSFTIDQSLVPSGQDATTFQMFRNGILIPNCLGATTIPAANLDPCITGRESIQGDVRLTILTTHASRWNMGLDNAAIGNAPYGANDSYSLDYGVPLVVQAPGLLNNDIARASITAQLNTPPDVGTLTLADSGAFTFTPAPGQCGPVTFKYVANDGAQSSLPATVTLTIDCLPHANNDTLSVLEDSGVTAITVLANDSDPDPGQTLTISSVTQGSNGTVAILPGGGAVTYSPNANYFGADSFTYTITDGRGGSATATVNVTVSPVNDAPSFTKGANQTVLEDAGPQTVLNWATAMSAGPANESAQALNFTVTTTNAALFSAQPAVSPSGTLTYTSAPDANGTATVTVVLHDDGGTVNGGVDASAGQSFTISVTPVNDAPVAVNGSLSTNEDTAASATLSASDVDGDALTYSIVTNGTKGTATITNASTGAYTYTPNANANGSDSFTFKVSDGTVNSNTATITVSIAAVNDAPVAANGSLTTNEDTAASATFSASDVDGDALTYIIVTNGTKGTATLTNAASGAFTYTPNLNANGSDSVTFKVNDGTVDSNTATMSIAITPVNDAPVAANGSLSTNEDTAANGTLSASDVDGDGLTYSIVANGTKGTATITNASTGAFTYTPNLNANGSDSFTFKVNDGTVDSNTATITVSVAPVNDAPVAANGSLTTNEDTAASATFSASDVDGDALTFSIVTNGTKGTATLTNAATGAFTYTPNLNANGSDSVTFKVNDGTVNSNTATMSITITPVNDAPVAANGSLSTNEDTAASGTLAASDVDGDALTYSIVANGTKGTATITNAVTGAYTYTPNANANGSDSFTFKANDGAVNSNTATVTITIAAVNDAPVAANGSLTTNEDTAASATFSASDVDGDALTFSIVTNGTKGTATLTNAATGAFTYTPNLNANGSDSLTFKVNDGTVNSNTATVSVTIVPVNDAPVAANASASTNEDTSVSGTVSATDVDGDALSYSIVTNGTKGTATITNASTGAFTYTPNANANGSDTFTFRASDGSLFSNTATVTVTIAAINDAPSFTRGADQTVLEDAAAQTVAGWATGISAGPADESGQALNFIVSNSNNALFSAQPAIAANGTLTFTPAANANGSATVTVQLHDNGGGADTSAAQTFTINVTAVNDAPSFVKGANQSAMQDSGAHTVTTWATSISTGPSDESSQTVNFIVSNSNNLLFSVQPAISAAGALTYTSAASASGSATVTVSLQDSGGTANGGVDTSAAQTFTITIIPKPTIAVADSSVYEGNSGLTPMPFAVTLSGSSLDTVTVDWTTANGTALAPKDFVAASGTLTFAPGETSKTITVQINGDTTKEKDETMGVRLSNAVNSTIADGSGLGTILDDDATPRLQAQMVGSSPAATTTTSPASSMALMTATDTAMLSGPADTTSAVIATATTATPPNVVEGNNGRTLVTFAVTPTNATDVPMTVDFVTIAGPSARANIDFITNSGTLVFPAETTDPQFITVEVVGNVRHQPNHPFFVRLANPVAAVIDGLDAEADILDDDPVPSISVSDVTIGESMNGTVNALVNVTLSNDTDDVITMNYATRPGTALDGVDYIGQSGTLTFAPGVTSQTVTIVINPDTSMAEGLENFYVDLSNAVNGTIVKGTATVTITPITAWVNSTTADFSAGTIGTGAYISETSNGEVTLAPTVGTEFSGTALPLAWTSTVLAAGGTSVVGGGSLTVNGTSVLASTAFGPGRSLEFVATFGGGNNQNVGMGLTTALVAPFAMFGTKTDGQFYARSVAPGQAFETPIPGSWFGAPHRFRIDYGTTTVTYWIDGVQKVVHTITYPTKSSSMRPAATDLTVDGNPVKVDWMRMTPYAGTGAYTSKVYDAGAPVTWTTATWMADMPAGGGVTIEVRTGNTATPDATWTAFTKILNSGDAMPAGLARYAQYRVTLTTADVTAAPAVKDVILAFQK